MSTKYKFADPNGIYFITSTVVGWVDVFTRELYREILLGSIKYSQINKGMLLHAWVLMTNHFHMVCSFGENSNPGMVIKELKSFVAMKVIDAIINNKQESRRKWMLRIFEEAGKEKKNNYKYQFWTHENHPILLDTEKKVENAIDYTHFNPVKAGFVVNPEDWKYSSAVDYLVEGGKGLLKIDWIKY